ncbi:MAG: 4'-phosphopantetheinyl transferase family protein [Bacteroidota bacterium]
MPLFTNAEVDGGGRLAVWRIEETPEELKKFIPDETFYSLMQRPVHPRRRIQKLALEALLREAQGDIADLIHYSALGKPLLPAGKGFISIAHNPQHVAVIVHPRLACGIDVERTDRRALKVSERFMHPEESDWVRESHRAFDATLVWAVKECLFKQLGEENVPFRDGLRVNKPLFMGSRSGTGSALAYRDERTHYTEYRFTELGGDLLAYTFSQPNRS